MPSEDAAAALALDRGNALLLVIDVQERLATAMQPVALARLKKTGTLLKAGTSAINFEIRAEQRLLWNASERRDNRLLLFGGRRANV